MKGFKENERLWIECKIKDTDNLYDLGLNLFPEDYIPYPADHLHITLFHFGTMNGLYSKILKTGKNINKKDFFNNYSIFLQNHCNILSFSQEILIEEIELFGNENEPKAVLIIKNNESLKQANESIYHEFIKLLEIWDINDIERFLQSNANFRYSTPKWFTPHISLGKLKYLNSSHSYPININPIIINISESRISSRKI